MRSGNVRLTLSDLHGFVTPSAAHCTIVLQKHQSVISSVLRNNILQYPPPVGLQHKSTMGGTHGVGPVLLSVNGTTYLAGIIASQGSHAVQISSSWSQKWISESIAANDSAAADCHRSQSSGSYDTTPSTSPIPMVKRALRRSASSHVLSMTFGTLPGSYTDAAKIVYEVALGIVLGIYDTSTTSYISGCNVTSEVNISGCTVTSEVNISECNVSSQVSQRLGSITFNVVTIAAYTSAVSHKLRILAEDASNFSRYVSTAGSLLGTSVPGPANVTVILAGCGGRHKGDDCSPIRGVDSHDSLATLGVVLAVVAVIAASLGVMCCLLYWADAPQLVLRSPLSASQAISGIVRESNPIKMEVQSPFGTIKPITPDAYGGGIAMIQVEPSPYVDPVTNPAQLPCHVYTSRQCCSC